jgi:hypothetical protein
VETLKTTLEKKEEELHKHVNHLNTELQEKLGRPEEDLKPLIQMEEVEYQKYLDTQGKMIEDWKSSAMSSITQQREDIAEKIKVNRKKIIVFP